MVIAIATANPDSVPETYVRQHIRKIAPSETVVLYFHGNAQCLENVPSYNILYERSSTKQHFRKIENFFKYAYPGAVTGSISKGVVKFLKKYKVQTVFAEFGPTGCALLPICQAMGIKLIVNFHGHDATVMPKRWLIRRAYRHLNTHAEGFICGSRHFAEVLENLGFSREKIHIVPCGIEVSEFNLCQEKDPNLLIAVGRFTEKKAPHLTIQAFSKIKTDFPDARLEMIGDGLLLANCKHLSKKLNLEDSIIFHGAKPHDFVKQKLARASIFLQHSVTAPNGDTESQGISLLEAMASGVPVVSTRHNGFVETVLEGKTGYLVNERDVDAMAQAISTLLNNDGLRMKMQIAGRKHVEDKFEATKQAQRLRHILMSTT